MLENALLAHALRLAKIGFVWVSSPFSSPYGPGSLCLLGTLLKPQPHWTPSLTKSGETVFAEVEFHGMETSAHAILTPLCFLT